MSASGRRTARPEIPEIVRDQHPPDASEGSSAETPLGRPPPTLEEARAARERNQRRVQDLLRVYFGD
jgi:hypothetical protein